MGNNHSHWFDSSKRKILVLGFEDYYLKQISQFVSNKDIEINDSIGFVNEEINYSKLSLKVWYLTVNNRHLWKHHFIGSQGLIITFAFTNRVKDKRIIYEVMNVLSDQNIMGLPVLLLFDKNNKDIEVEEELKKEMKNQMTEDVLNTIKLHTVDFEKEISQLKEGFDWLCEKMKPLK